MDNDRFQEVVLDQLAGTSLKRLLGLNRVYLRTQI